MTTAQSIIPNRIEWSMSGKTIIITGANTGIGKATALELAKMGMRRLIIACKNVAAGEAAAVEIRERCGGLAPDVVAVRQLDLSSLDSIRKFAHDIIAHEPDLHILINNAGYYGGSRQERKITNDGFELTFAVNYLGHYLLTLLLLPVLKRSAPSRIVNLTTGTFWLKLCRVRGFRVDDPNFDRHPRDYTPTQAYSLSKLATILFTRTLHRHLHPVIKDDFSVEPLDIKLADALPSSLSLDPRIFDINNSSSAPSLISSSINSPVLNSSERYGEILAEDKSAPTAESQTKSPVDRQKSVKLPPEKQEQKTPLPTPTRQPRASIVSLPSSIRLHQKPQPKLSMQISSPPSISEHEQPNSPPPSEIASRKANRKPDIPVVSVYAVSPGSFIRSDLYRHLSRGKRRLMAPFYKTPELAAVMTTYCASANGIENLSGKYFAKARPVEPPAIASNEALAIKLWQMSAKLIDDATNRMIIGSSNNKK